MDGEVSALVESLRAGAGRLAGELAALETNMGELYDAASGHGPTRAVAGERPAQHESGAAAPPQPRATAPSIPAPPTPEPPSGAAAPQVRRPRRLAAAAVCAEATLADGHLDPSAAPAADRRAGRRRRGGDGDLDGAQAVALNMALNGESRESTDRYLAENYELTDRAQAGRRGFAAIEA